MVSSRTIVLLATSILFANTGICQAQGSAVTADASAEAVATPDAPTGLPTFLLEVPGGPTWMGIEKDQLLKVVRETVNPRRPELADKAPNRVKKWLKNTASELGRKQIIVDRFLLGKWPVTNGEYLVFVDKMKALGTPVRPPFHWWRIGRKDDYDNRLGDIHDEFKAEGKYGPILFWERYGTELPYKLVDDKGNDISNLPVSFVSYRDAVKFAGWLGMRLPSEPEWTRAARGDGENIWPWGTDENLGDRYSEDILGHLKLKNSRDLQLKPVGSVELATGPFGHVDMTTQVWELTSERGFRPINGQQPFEAEWKRMLKDKLGVLAANAPLWKDNVVVAKGGSYLSAGDPIQLHIDSRVSVATNDVLGGAGFRLAKSFKPGYDFLYSLITSDYNSELFEVEQETDLSKQMGIERYVISDNGFPENYHAVSFAPLNFLTANKAFRQTRRLAERSQVSPILVGTLATTEKLAEPDLKPGIYTVAWRQKGVSRELANAIKTGYKAVQGELKRRAKGAEATPYKGPWLAVLKRAGLTPEDLEPEGANTKLNFIRMDGFKVPTNENQFVFYNNEGKWVAHCPASKLVDGKTPPGIQVAPQLVGENEKLGLTMVCRVPILKDNRREAEYTFRCILDQAPSANWRIPQ
ncbi:MAG: SUMF1/EgtB/PvdO family nonheme iron enzyme [Planctomycetota bacterium]|nr:SUMF1/EgtB/PvdO family nonheme iron enzyme [Planctomycetota bacterium]